MCMKTGKIMKNTKLTGHRKKMYNCHVKIMTEMFQGITEPREVQYNDKNNDRESDFGHLICACN